MALAEELDLPVLIHTAGLGASTSRTFRTSRGNPLSLEEVVLRHPKLRIYFENAGYPFLADAIALMYHYAQVYADVSTITWLIPQDAFYHYRQGLVRAGLGKRLVGFRLWIIAGSDRCGYSANRGSNVFESGTKTRHSVWKRGAVSADRADAMTALELAHEGPHFAINVRGSSPLWLNATQMSRANAAQELTEGPEVGNAPKTEAKTYSWRREIASFASRQKP